MPLYELFCVAVPSAQSAPLRELIRTTSRTVIDHGGAVRGMQYWGRRVLPQRARRHQQWHSEGDDPRVIKWTTLKLGERLDQITPRPANRGESSASHSQHDSHMGGGLTVMSRSSIV